MRGDVCSCADYGVPAHNFFGWFTVSLLIFTIVGVLFGRGRHVNTRARHVGLSILLFFTLIALVHKLILAGVFGIALFLLHLTLSVLPIRAGAPETNKR
jgi:uncharacterized membrane protein